MEFDPGTRVDDRHCGKGGWIGTHGARMAQWNSYNDNPPTYVYYATTKNPSPTGEYASVVNRPFEKYRPGHDPAVSEDRLVQRQQFPVRVRASLLEGLGSSGVLRHE
jgi:hypothetical protein